MYCEQAHQMRRFTMHRDDASWRCIMNRRINDASTTLEDSDTCLWQTTWILLSSVLSLCRPLTRHSSWLHSRKATCRTSLSFWNSCPRMESRIYLTGWHAASVHCGTTEPTLFRMHPDAAMTQWWTTSCCTQKSAKCKYFKSSSGKSMVILARFVSVHTKLGM